MDYFRPSLIEDRLGNAVLGYCRYRSRTSRLGIYRLQIWFNGELEKCFDAPQEELGWNIQ